MINGGKSMGVRFILGRAGTGKSGRAIDEIIEKSISNPQGPLIFYLVPDQMTFEQEYTLFKDQDLQGSIRTQVVSFSRLAWRILQETGGAVRQFISSVGIQMVLRKIIEEKQGDWLVFQKAMEKQGFLDQLENIITEFKRYEITPEILRLQQDHLNQYVHKEPGEVALANKLEDLIYIYEKLMQSLQDNYIDSEDQLQLLAEKINDTDFLNDAEVYIDGFHNFTPIELSVIETLMKKCKQVTVLLTVDQPTEEKSDLDLFYKTSETYHTLQSIAQENNINIEETITLQPENGRFKERPYFLHLEQHFNETPSPAYQGQVPIKLAEAVHPRAEVEGVAQEILHLVRDKNYRYRDIALFLRQPDTYHDLIATIFKDYNIPVFIDEKQTMLNHPLIEFLRSVFEIVEGNWRYEPVFRVLKTGFIPSCDRNYPLTKDAIDELENYILEYGIRSRSRWLSDDDWIFQRFRGFDQAAQTNKELEIQERINRYRKQVTFALEKFDNEIRHATTVRELCEVTYTLLEDIDAPSRLERMREMHDEEGAIEKGREQEQVWDAVIQLFDEMVEMVGDEPMKLTTYRSILEAGLETLEFAHVPPTIDHVIVGTVEHSRISGIKGSFLLGVNEGVWPLKPPVDGMINERERDLLAEQGLKLADTSRRQLLDDWFDMYTVFTSGRDFLWLSYPISDEEGKSQMPSQLIKQIEDLFPVCSDRLLLQEPDELLEANRFIITPNKTRAALTSQLARYRKGYPIHSVWWHVLNWYITHHEKHETTYTTLQSLYYQNVPSELTSETVNQLYPKKVKTSISRLESYYRCSYQHFARYSLGLEERKTYQLDAPDIGLLFHEALKTITEWIQEEGQDFAKLTKQDASGYAQKAVNKLSPILQHQILHSSNRYKYIQKKLQEVIARATHILSEQARQSDFSPIGLELGFGEDQSLDPLILPLPNGFELVLRGQIDRVDKSINDGNLYLRIIDYKSSARGLNLVEVYYGLALQMLAYLDVVLSQSEQWLGLKATPGGILYFHVHNPMLSKDQVPTDEIIEEDIFKEYKMQGLLKADGNVVQMMDHTLDSGRSDIIPAGLKKDGSFYKDSKVADEETFASLRNHVHELMVQAGIDITSGGVHLNPFQYKQNTACTFCPFRSVCQFEPILESNQYHRLKDMKDDEILAQLRKNISEIE